MPASPDAEARGRGLDIVDDGAPEARAGQDDTGRGNVAWLDEIWSRRSGGGQGARAELSIGVLLWPGFPMMSLAGIIEPLRHAADFADHSRPIQCRWSVMGEPGYAAAASCGLRVPADQPYLDPTDFDYVAVIGGLLPQLGQAPQRHRAYLHAAARAGVPLIGVCTGPFVLAQEGLLADCRVAVHPFHHDDFRRAFPGIRAVSREDFLIDGRRITAPGGISILSLMTELIGRHCGADRAAKVVHQLSVAGRPEAGVFEKAQACGHRPAADARVQRAVVLIESRMGQDVALDAVAREVGVGARQLTRLFRENLGMTPKRFIIETRLRHAHWLVQNSSLSMTAIAYQTGFADCAHFATSFKAKFGAPPSRLRRAGGMSLPDQAARTNPSLAARSLRV